MDRPKKDFLQNYPSQLLRALAEIAQERGATFYIAGGTVRDWFLSHESTDLDITVAADGFGWAHSLAGRIDGTFVGMDKAEDVARVVWQGIIIDVSGFREGARTIDADLAKRDFTINGLGIGVEASTGGEPVLRLRGSIIDPTNGLDDLKKRMIRCTSSAVFGSDPLRLLRAYRFMASLRFSIARQTAEDIRQQTGLIRSVAAERIAAELGLIMASGQACDAIRDMHGSGLLSELFPELIMGVGMDQPASHHLDVFEHSLATLGWMEEIQARPGRYFPGHDDAMAGYLAGGKRTIQLNWAALFHDIGKPATHGQREDKGGRITFYNHDMVGGDLFRKIAVRLKWGRDDVKQVSRFIELHMWPFHLNNVRRQAGLTPKAALRLVKAAGPELPGLFMLAMADTLAGRGDDRPQGIEENVAALYEELCQVYEQSIKPVLEQPRLLTGVDLQELFSLTPGPIFKTILDGLQQAQVAGEVCSRVEAIEWVRAFLEQGSSE